MSYAARSLDDLTRGAISAVFHAGASPLGHHWEIIDGNDAVLAASRRVHHGGKLAQKFWKLSTLTGMGVGDNIHIDLIGADGPLARATSINDKPAIVTVTDPAGVRVARSERRGDTLTVYGPNDERIAEITCGGEGPWPVRDGDGATLGELLAGEPGPSRAVGVSVLVDPQFALNTAAYARSMHLGLRRARRYAYNPATKPQPLALALLPLLCALTY
ncbi:hypothetical protein [Mycobacterium shimoidei]|uniref:hypothetical protein n=1 Tax=Mycobacterium shimoidei TaxID=29313 RepID=UPI0008489DFC|nr:hypothetical protein [Mycobacterium shimoidei]MCV7258727.1 hypothetical protein [Mycobacterium shimoidei]ODR15358.1 hypothetical protein BHQ16_01055 [Mycobacterium shimoidei]ORW79937.1 hypothetical protein AWC26_13650 [Mycobacterium shimoidei]